MYIKSKFTILFVFFFVGLNWGLSARDIDSEHLSGSLYVKFKSKDSKQKFSYSAESRVSVSNLPLQAKYLKQYSVREEARSLALSFSDKLDGVYRIEIGDTAKVNDFMEELARDPQVEYVERVPVRRVNGLVNDPYYGTVENLNLKWHWDLIRTEEAWAKQKGNPAIKVAIVDNAVWGEHEDLGLLPQNQYNVHTGKSSSTPPMEIEQNKACTANDINGGTCPALDWSHGTHCAGLVGAKNNNGIGIASLAGGVTLMGVSCGVEDGIAMENTTEGIKWAVENGAKLINCSFGGYKGSKTEETLIKAAIEKGIVIVASAGNDNVMTPCYPASYNGVISVGSCDFDKKRSAFSNYGSSVDVLAPGGQGPQNATEIYSSTFSPNHLLRLYGLESFTGKYYENMVGTSMAGPIVSSLCALMLSKDSSLNSYDIRQILMSTAQMSLLSGIVENSGVIDAAAAMQALETYVKPFMPRYVDTLMVLREKGSLVPQISWRVDATQTVKPDFFRIYRDNVLLADNIAIDKLSFNDSNSRGSYVHCYEFCEVKDGIESYRLEILYQTPVQYNVYLTAEPVEGGSVSGSGIYEHGAYATLVAKANPDYTFLYWRFVNQVYSERDSIVVRIGSNANMQAVFQKTTDLEESVDISKTLSVFPNPATNFISIRLENGEEIKSLGIYDLGGRKVRDVNTSQEETISIEALKQGIYILRVETDENLYSAKMVKK